MNKQQNTQQPVAWQHTLDSTEGIAENEPWVVMTDSPDNPFGVPGRDYSESFPWTAVPLYTAPPVPRDVLMAVAEEVRASLSAVVCDSSEPWVASSQFDLDAIVDRYASQVQPERNTVTLEEMVEQLKAGENGDAISEAMTQATADMALGRAIREGRAAQPEPVNQQLLARWLAFGKAMQKAGSDLPRHLIADTEAALAADEAAQPVAEQSAEPMAWYTDWHPDGRKYAETPHGFDDQHAVLNDESLIEEVWFPLYAAQQPASAQPVAVPECPYPCGWQQLHKLAVEDGAYLARAIDEDEPVTSNARDTTMRVVGNLIAVTRAMLSEAQKQEGKK